MTQREAEPQPARYDERYEEEEEWKRANRSDLSRLLERPLGEASADFQKLVAQPTQPVAPSVTIPKYMVIDYAGYMGRSPSRVKRRCPLCGKIGDPPICGGPTGNGPYELVEIDE